jgi:DNA-binding winged helix-turn-helix (wHTH) protein
MPYDRSFDVHISHLRKKLGPQKNMIRTVRGEGYQFCVDEWNRAASPIGAAHVHAQT